MKRILLAIFVLAGCESVPPKPAENGPVTASVVAPPTPVQPVAVAPAAPPAAAPLVAPFDIEFVRKARWAPGREGFDAKLPGYHLAGDIARIKLIPKPLENPYGRHPETITLTLQTSPGMPANVENLTITAGGLSLSTALSNGSDGKNQIEVRRLSDGPRGKVALVPQSDYLELKAVEGSVHVRLLPAAMELLKAGGELSWIDWYRG